MRPQVYLINSCPPDWNSGGFLKARNWLIVAQKLKLKAPFLTQPYTRSHIVASALSR